MKNVSLILNIILVIAVGTLFYLHFHDQQPKVKQIVAADGKPIPGMLIAYMDIDSFQLYFNYFKIKKKELEASQSSVENELAKEEDALQNAYVAFQQKAETMTEQEGMEAQQKLMMQKDQFDEHKQTRTNQLMQKAQDFQIEMHEMLVGFLKEYNSDKRYAYILPYSKDAPSLMYVDPAYEVTADVIKGMNEKYKDKK